VELEATEVHLHKAWKSNDHYYRKKYPGFLNRARQFVSWLKFKILHYIWGNGESVAALLTAVAALVAALAALDLYLNPLISELSNIYASLLRAPQILLGINPPNYFSPVWMTIITLVRLIAFALFMSILIKRFNRR
jgi:hypothetical protein